MRARAPTDGRFYAFVGIAIALHALVAIEVAREKRTDARRMDGTHETELAIEVVAPSDAIEAPASPSEPASPPSPAQAGASAIEPHAASRGTPGSTASSASSSASSASEVVAAPGDAAPGDAATWSIDTRVHEEAKTAFSMNRSDPNDSHATSGASESERVRAETKRAFREAFAKHDAEIGLGASGPLVTAVHDAAREIALTEGRASFVISIGPDGVVRNVRATNFTGDAREWNEAARAVAASLVQVPIRIPNGAQGVEVWLGIDIAVRMPSGRRQGDGPDLHSEGVGMRFGGFDITDLGSKPVRSVRVFREREEPTF